MNVEVDLMDLTLPTSYIYNKPKITFQHNEFGFGLR